MFGIVLYTRHHNRESRYNCIDIERRKRKNYYKRLCVYTYLYRIYNMMWHTHVDRDWRYGFIEINRSRNINFISYNL